MDQKQESQTKLVLVDKGELDEAKREQSRRNKEARTANVTEECQQERKATLDAFEKERKIAVEALERKQEIEFGLVKEEEFDLQDAVQDAMLQVVDGGITLVNMIPGTSVIGLANVAQWDWNAYIYGSSQGQYMALAFIGVFLVSTGTCAWMYLTPGNGDFDQSLNHAFWLSWGLFFDPGTQTGLAGTDAHEAKIVAVTWSLLGFIFNLAVLGIVVDKIRESMDDLRTLYSSIQGKDHTVILNWSPKTLFLLKELLWAADRPKVIVIMSEDDPKAIRNGIDSHFKQSVLRGVAIKIWTGDPRDADDLQRVSLQKAKQTFILGSGTDPRDSDQQVIQVVLAMETLPFKLQGTIVCDIYVGSNKTVIDAIGVNMQMFPVHSHMSVVSMLALASISPPLAMGYIDAASSVGGFGHEKDDFDFYMVKVLESMSGTTFEELAFNFDKILPIGVMQAGEDHLTLAPEDSYKLQFNDQVLVLAQEKPDDLCFVEAGLIKKCAPLNDNIIPDITKDTFYKYVDPEMQIKRTICVVGWTKDILDYLQCLDVFAAAGTEVIILSAYPIESRDSMMYEEGYYAREVNEDGEIIYSRTDRWFKNLEIKHEFGRTTNSFLLKKLPLHESYSIVFKSGDMVADGGDIDTLAADTDCLTALMKVKGFMKKKGTRGVYMWVQMLDPRTEKAISSNKKLQLPLVTFFHCNSYETGFLAIGAASWPAWLSIQDLLDPGGGADVSLVDVRAYLNEDDFNKSLDWWNLWQRVRMDRNWGGKDVLMGVVQDGELFLGRAFKPLTLKKGDRFLVVLLEEPDEQAE